jgi:hypothetical protein
MTKDEFRKRAHYLIEQLCGMPDEFWKDTRPLMRATYEDEVLVVGLEAISKRDEEEWEDRP